MKNILTKKEERAIEKEFGGLYDPIGLSDKIKALKNWNKTFDNASEKRKKEMAKKLLKGLNL